MSEIKATRVTQFKRSAPDNLPTFYANNVEIRTTQWDIRLSFGQITDMTDDGVISVTDQCQLYLSPQHAKTLLRVLKQQVETYETKVGPIPGAGDLEE
jgi:hypothetical protein